MLAHIHPSRLWFACRSRPFFNGIQLVRLSVRGWPRPAKCPEPLYPLEVLPLAVQRLVMKPERILLALSTGRFRFSGQLVSPRFQASASVSRTLSFQSPFLATVFITLRYIRGRYPSFIATTGSCARPSPSHWLQLSLFRWVFAGCHQSLLGIGPSRRYLCEPFPACLDPYPGGSYGALARFFP